METAKTWYDDAMTDYDARESREERFQRFKKTEGYQECLQTGFERALSDTNLVAEAIGPDGIRYPFNTNTLTADPEKRKEIVEGMKGFDALYYRNIGVAILTNDEALLGRIMMPHARQYLMEIAEDFVDDNWEAWDK